MKEGFILPLMKEISPSITKKTELHKDKRRMESIIKIQSDNPGFKNKCSFRLYKIFLCNEKNQELTVISDTPYCNAVI